MKMLEKLYRSHQKLVHSCFAKEAKLGQRRKNRWVQLREYIRADSLDRQKEGILDSQMGDVS